MASEYRNIWITDVAGIRIPTVPYTRCYLSSKLLCFRTLCENLCSLNPGVDRLTFSVEWIMSETGEIEEEWFGRTVIKSCVKLAYEHAQHMIDEPGLRFIICYLEFNFRCLNIITGAWKPNAVPIPNILMFWFRMVSFSNGQSEVKCLDFEWQLDWTIL